MKKILFLACFALIGSLHAADETFLIPSDVHGTKDGWLRSAGVNNAVLVTSTNAALATDADGNTMTNGYIHWIIVPATSAVTDAAGPFVVLRATGTANLTSTMLIPPVWAMEHAAGTAGAGPQQQVQYFDPPIPFENGLSVNIGPAGITPGTNQSFAVGVRWKRRL